MFAKLLFTMGPDFTWSNPVLTTTMLPDPRHLYPGGHSSSPVYQNISIPLIQNNVPNNIKLNNQKNRVGVCRPIVSMPKETDFWECQGSLIDAPMLKCAYDVPRPAVQASNTVSQYCFASKLSEEEQVILRETHNYLDQCSYFYPDFQMEEARRRLSDYEVGTFLLRPSSDPNYLLSLSVKTSRGTTSVRIAFKNKKFYLDSDPKMRHQLPTFENIPCLLNSYRKLATSVHKNRVVFLEASGRKDTPITLKTPCLKYPGGLKHLCRVAIHGLYPLDTLHQLPGASTSIIDFLQKYPHSV